MGQFFGDLWHFPFWADVYGTFAAWLGAALTGGALFVASLVYRRDSNLARDAQAKKIHARVVDPTDFDKAVVHVDNYSEAAIFDIGVLYEKILWREVDLDHFDYGADGEVIPTSVSTTYRKWKKTASPITYRDSAAWSIAPGARLDQGVTRFNEFQIVSVSFQDIKGQPWILRNLLVDGGPKLERATIAAPALGHSRFGAARHPVDLWRRRQLRRKIDSLANETHKKILREDEESARAFREKVKKEQETAASDARQTTRRFWRR